jgi:hypothetical protein
MNQHDRNNLNFLLNTSFEEFKVWFDSLSQDEQKYACELLSAYERELDAQLEELAIEESLELLNGQYPDARSIIKSIQEQL